jgi:Histidine phosphatase superfamily (branch 1)
MSHAQKLGRLVLVRHTVVAEAWRTRCYGATDVPLGQEGRLLARQLARELASWRPALVYCSPLRRARLLAARIAKEADVPLRTDSRLAERNFGSWEGRSWDEIYAETGSRTRTLFGQAAGKRRANSLSGYVRGIAICQPGSTFWPSVMAVRSRRFGGRPVASNRAAGQRQFRPQAASYACQIQPTTE